MLIPLALSNSQCSIIAVFILLGLHIPELLEAILKLFPLDTYVVYPVCYHFYGIFSFRMFIYVTNAQF